MINVVVCTDHNYIMPCGVMLYSLCKNNTVHEICFFVVVDESVSQLDKESLIEVSKNSSNITLQFLQIDGHIFDNFPNLGDGMYVTKATYYRLYLSEILPKTIDKVLYLDCDMIIRKDISPLWNTNIDNVAAAVATDGMDGIVQLYNRLGYLSEKGYFNAGMMLINLKYWRENNILGKCLSFIERFHNRIVSHDQDVLNVVLQDSKINVDISYNFGECFLYKLDYMQFDYLKYKSKIDKVIQDPVIVHYTISKPWKKDCMNPFKSLFLKYRNETQWASVPLERTHMSPKQYTKKIIKRILFRMGLIHSINSSQFRELCFNLDK